MVLLPWKCVIVSVIKTGLKREENLTAKTNSNRLLYGSPKKSENKARNLNFSFHALSLDFHPSAQSNHNPLAC
jgi:hypothetical protein